MELDLESLEYNADYLIIDKEVPGWIMHLSRGNIRNPTDSFFSVIKLGETIFRSKQCGIILQLTDKLLSLINTEKKLQTCIKRSLAMFFLEPALILELGT